MLLVWSFYYYTFPFPTGVVRGDVSEGVYFLIKSKSNLVLQNITIFIQQISSLKS